MELKKLIKNLKLGNAYFLDNEVSQLVIEHRIKHGLTQKALADKIGTKQTAIARLENGYLPSLAFLARIANSLGYDVIVNFKKHSR